MARTIKIFDTTLRDGEQAPGFSMNLAEKVEMAKQLERLGVDVIEAGFAAASPGDFAAVQAVAKNINRVAVACLSRLLKKDIDIAAEALALAKKPRIHLFIATSDLHLEYKLKMSREQILAAVGEMVAYAKTKVEDIQFCAEDASRSDREFLYQVYAKAIEAGATVINITDTVGYSAPEEFARLVCDVRENVPNIKAVDISVHCHNDLGMAVANSLAAVQAGASQVDCTVNGIGERAGNASLEEFVMNLSVRKDVYHACCQVDTREIYKTSALLSSITGIKVQPNKAVVGANAFAHEAGIHQHGIMANRKTYEVITPESIGLPVNKIVLGKHSGKHALNQRLLEMGYALTAEELDQAFKKFKALADRKKEVSDRELEVMVIQRAIQIPQTYQLANYSVSMGNSISSTAWVQLVHKSGQVREAAVASHEGPITAAFQAISQIVRVDFQLVDFVINAVTPGTDAQGEVYAKIRCGGRIYTGSSVGMDTVEASICAYIDAVNTMLWAMGRQ